MERTRYPVAPQGNSAAAYRQFFGKDSRVAKPARTHRTGWLTNTIARAFALTDIKLCLRRGRNMHCPDTYGRTVLFAWAKGRRR